MPITIETVNDKKYVVAGDYTLDQFREKFMENQEDYIHFNAEIDGTIIPTFVMRSGIVTIHEFEKESEQKQNPRDYFNFN